MANIVTSQLAQVDNEDRIDSRLIAKGLDIQHRSLMQLIRDHQTELEEYGILRFENAEIKGRGQPEKYTMLNLLQFVAIGTHARSTAKNPGYIKMVIGAFQQLQKENLQLRQSQTLLLPERVTDKQAVEVLGKIQTLVKAGDIGEKLSFNRRDGLDFCLQKAQGFFEGKTVQHFNMDDEADEDGNIHPHEYPPDEE